jgi:hypothetical protein
MLDEYISPRKGLINDRFLIDYNKNSSGGCSQIFHAEDLENETKVIIKVNNEF